MPDIEPHGPVLIALKKSGDPLWETVTHAALARARSVPAAAKILGIGRRTLERWLGEHPSLRRHVALPDAGRPVPSASGIPRSESNR